MGMGEGILNNAHPPFHCTTTYTTNGKLSFCPPNHTTSTSEIKELLFLKTADPSLVAFWYRATCIYRSKVEWVVGYRIRIWIKLGNESIIISYRK
jgi:hypothetical protein